MNSDIPNGDPRSPFSFPHIFQAPAEFPMALPLMDAELYYLPNVFGFERALSLYGALEKELSWQQRPIQIYGREVMQPRLSVWVGDSGVAYTYSHTRHEPDPWTPTLSLIKAELEAICHWRFNSVLGNLYRDGADGMGWHSDNEPELGEQPVIASLSLGQERRFTLRKRNNPAQKHALVLAHDSLLLMAGYTQRHWQHALPKSKKQMDGRINLTFRWVF